MESAEIQLARMDERVKMILDRMEEGQEAHALTRRWMERTDHTLHDINARVSNVETSLAKNAPTIEEFMVIKQQVIGAGMAGRWLWVGLGTVLGLIISLKDTILRIFTTT